MNFYEMFYGYRKRGPGIDPNAPKPKGLKLLWCTFKREWWTLVKLNILFWLTCLLVVTVPAALKGMTRVVVTLLRDEPCDLWHDYWGAFKEGFLRTTAVGALMAGLIAAACTGIWFYGTAMKDNGAFAAPVLVLVLAVVVLVMMLFSLFPMLEFSELRAGEAIRNALFLTMVRLPQSLAALLVILAMAAAYWLAYPYSAVFLPAIALSLAWLVACFASWPGLARYVFHLEEAQGAVPMAKATE